MTFIDRHAQKIRGDLKTLRKRIDKTTRMCRPISGVLSNQNGGVLSLMSWFSSLFSFSKNKIATSWVVIKIKTPIPKNNRTVIKSTFISPLLL